jgi:hypothetical protein
METKHAFPADFACLITIQCLVSTLWSKEGASSWPVAGWHHEQMDVTVVRALDDDRTVIWRLLQLPGLANTLRGCHSTVH